MVAFWAFTACCVFSLFPTFERICCLLIQGDSRGQPTKSGPPAWGLGEVLTTPHRKKLPSYESFDKASDLD
jgi:hypothetical protein